jgi:hypothetical protein
MHRALRAVGAAALAFLILGSLLAGEWGVAIWLIGLFVFLVLVIGILFKLGPSSR